MMASLAEAARMLSGARPVGDPSIRFDRVSTDTRTLAPGDLFVALRGERFDAHAFLPEARAAGAVAAIADTGLAAAGLAGLEVDDTLAALTTLAGAWRGRFALPLIAVTGSNGKTTVTQMIASILRAWLGDAAFATAGNLNNHIGVPLMLLRLRAEHRGGVLELGMNHPGEIAGLAALTAPAVALVTNAQREHQEFMGSVEAVARENGAAIGALGMDGTAVFPHDDPHANVWRALAAGRAVTTFGLVPAPVGTPSSVVPAGEPAWRDGRWHLELDTPAGRTRLALAVAGRHNLRNALAATAAALAVGAPLDAVVRGLEGFAPVAGRSQLRRLERGGRAVTLVDDTYNANPDSVRAAIEVLAALPAPRWLVLGDMGEVGDEGPAFHREVGAYAKAQGIEALWTVGHAATHAAEAFGGARHFEDMASLLTALADAPDCASIVVKGSRFMRTEQVVAALLEAVEPSTRATRERRDGDLHAA